MTQTTGDLQANTRMRVGEISQIRRQAVGGEIVRHAEAHFAFHRTLPQRQHGFVHQCDDAVGVTQQAFALGGGHHVAATAVEQLGAKLLLKAPHLLADGGLGQVQTGSRAGETTGLHHGEKTA